MAFIADYTNALRQTNWKALHEFEVACGDRCSECTSFIRTEGLGCKRKCEDCDPEAWIRPPSVHLYFVRCPECGRLSDIKGSEDYLASSGNTKVFCCSNCCAMITGTVLPDGFLESGETKPKTKQDLVHNLLDEMLANSATSVLESEDLNDWN